MAGSFITACYNVKRHRKELEPKDVVLQNCLMGDENEYPFVEQGRRLRLLRQAEGIRTGSAFAQHLGWGQPGYSQFETGKRQVPMPKAMELRSKIPGFDPLWLWDNDKRGLSFDLRRRIEAEEAKEPSSLARGERQDV
jgi:transcriptional regulator with XRE-family HTH domain